ncbi:MAG: hypothetical protein ACXVAY_22730 [Mucilaginibacter sp.]
MKKSESKRRVRNLYINRQTTRFSLVRMFHPGLALDGICNPKFMVNTLKASANGLTGDSINFRAIN